MIKHNLRNIDDQSAQIPEQWWSNINETSTPKILRIWDKKTIEDPKIENQWLEFEWEGNWSIENAHKKSLESENHTNSQTLPDFVMGILM